MLLCRPWLDLPALWIFFSVAVLVVAIEAVGSSCAVASAEWPGSAGITRAAHSGTTEADAGQLKELQS